MASVPPRQNQPEQAPSDLGTRIQNILPFAFVLALGWLVLAEWRLSEAFPGGRGRKPVLTLALVVRMGVRAGEIELHHTGNCSAAWRNRSLSVMWRGRSGWETRRWCGH